MPTINVQQKRAWYSVEIDLPFYWKHDLMMDTSDVIIFHRWDGKRHDMVTRTNPYDFSGNGRRGYEVESEPSCLPGSPVTEDAIHDNLWRLTAEEFDDVLEEAIQFITSVRGNRAP